MNIHFASTFIGALAGIAYVWFVVAAVLDCATSPRSDVAKINWITLILVVPVIGPLAFLVFGGAKKKEMMPSNGQAIMKEDEHLCRR